MRGFHSKRFSAERSGAGVGAYRKKLREICRYETELASARIMLSLFFVVATLVLGQQLAYRSYPGLLNEVASKPIVATGLKRPDIYAYGLFYWGLFPVYSVHEQNLDDPAKYDQDFARRLLVEHGETLRVEHEHEIRFGEHFKYFLPYLEAQFAGRPAGTSLKTVNAVCFVAAVLLLFLNLCLCDRPVLGFFAALFIASSGFQAREVLRSENFSYVITSAVLILAVTCPLLLDRQLRTSAILWRLLAAAAIVAAAANVRTTAIAMGVAPVFALLLYERRRMVKRALLVLCYGAFLYGWLSAATAFVDHKLSQANDFVEAVGGIPYEGERTALHPLWHPIYLGLADFDAKHGIRWQDNFGFQAARTKLEELSALGEEEGSLAGRTGGRYERMETSPLYASLLRRIVLDMVREDPGWYLNILGDRIQRIFRDWEPPTLDLLFSRVEPWRSIWTHLCFLLAFLALGMFSELKLILASLPTILVALLVTTMTNAHFYLIAHLLSAAVISAAIVSAGVYLIALAGRRIRTGGASQEPARA